MREMRWPASRAARAELCPGSSALAAMTGPAPRTAASAAGRALHLTAERAMSGEGNPEGSDDASRYAAFVLETLSRTPDAELLVEHAVELPGVPLRTLGRADAVIRSAGLTLIIDLKSGSVAVSPRSHQMMIYAAALLSERPDTPFFELIIVQPSSPEFVRRAAVSAEEVAEYVRDVIIPSQSQALSAAADADEHGVDAEWAERWLRPGAHCEFCPAKRACPVRLTRTPTHATDQIERVTAWMRSNPASLMTDAEVSAAARSVSHIRAWVRGVTETDSAGRKRRKAAKLVDTECIMV